MSTTGDRGPLSRGSLIVAVLAVTALALGGCSPVYDGITGITRDDQGRLVGLWQGCEEEPVGATLIQDSNTPSSVHIGEWVRGKPSSATSFLLEPSPAPEGWTTWRPGPTTFLPGHDYTLIAWKSLNESNAVPVDFAASDLTKLAPGSVLVEATNGPEKATVVTREVFDNLACRTN